MYLYKVASLSSILSVSLFVLIVKYFWAQNTAEGAEKGGLSHVLCPSRYQAWDVIDYKGDNALNMRVTKRTTYRIFLYFREFFRKFWHFIWFISVQRNGATVMLVTTECWWLYDGDNFYNLFVNGDRNIILVAFFVM